MSVLIKGMEMPISCIVCRLECLYRIHSSTSRSEHCPLIEVKDEPQTEPLPKTINGVKIADAIAWADKWLEDNPVSEMWDMVRTLRDATEWQDERQMGRSE